MNYKFLRLGKLIISMNMPNHFYWHHIKWYFAQINDEFKWCSQKYNENVAISKFAEIIRYLWKLQRFHEEHGMFWASYKSSRNPSPYWSCDSSLYTKTNIAPCQGHNAQQVFMNFTLCCMHIRQIPKERDILGLHMQK